MTRLEELPWEVRALAAERTAAVLKQRLRGLDAGTERTLFQRQLESAQRRAAEVERRRALSEVRSEELARHKSRLEGEVAARTAEIRTILDHVSAGLLLLDGQGQVLPGWSRQCATLLGTDDLTGRRFPDLLGWSEDEAAEFFGSLEQVFDDILLEELSTAQVKARAERHGKTVHISYAAVREGGQVHRVLATLVDVTPQIAAEAEAARHRALIQTWKQREGFRLFLQDARQQLVDAAEAVREGHDAFVRRVVHTIKGNSATFGVEEVVSTCHRVEDGPVIGADGLEAIRRSIDGFLAANADVLDFVSDGGGESFQIAAADLTDLLVVAQQRDAAALERTLQRLRQRPVGQFVEPLRASVRRLCERLDKEVHFVVSGEEVPVDPARLGPVLRCLPHLVRNAVDHGIEPADQRGDKPAIGTLSLRFHAEPGALRIEVADVGRGIDLGAVGQAAQARGLIDAAQASRLTPETAVRLICQNELSTASRITDVSGRGVGLGAVREAVQAAGGELRVVSQAGQGTRFEIRLSPA